MAKKTITSNAIKAKPVHSIAGGVSIDDASPAQRTIVAAALKRAGGNKALGDAKLAPGTHRVDCSLRLVGDITVGEATTATITTTDITAEEILAMELDAAEDFDAAMKDRVSTVAKCKRTEKGRATLKVALDRFKSAIAIHADKAGLVTKTTQPRAGAVKGDPQIFVLEAKSE